MGEGNVNHIRSGFNGSAQRDEEILRVAVDLHLVDGRRIRHVCHVCCAELCITAQRFCSRLFSTKRSLCELTWPELLVRPAGLFITNGLKLDA